MSLAPAVRDVSNHPAKNAVTEPTNREQLHEDLDRKLRLYGIIQALRVGKLPDNIQLDETLEYMATHSPVDLNALSPDGEELVADVRELIETTRQIIKQKNVDEVFQNFIWHTRGIDYTPAKINSQEAVTISAEQAKIDSLQAAHHLRTLLSLLVTNTEARKLLSDFSLIGRDLLARSADLVRPDEEALRQADQPVSSDQPAFVSRDDAAGLPRADEEIVNQKMKKARKSSGKGKETRDKLNKNAQWTGSDRDPNSSKDQSQDTMEDRLDRLKERVPGQYRDRVNAQFDRARHFFGEEYFPKERRERFIYRAKKVVVECQQDKQYQESIKWFLDTVPQYGREGIRAPSENKGSWNEGPFKEAVDELKLLLTRFANDTSPQPVIDTFRRLMRLVNEEEEMREWVGRIQEWMQRVLLEPGYVVEDQCNRDGITLREEGRKFYDDKYKAQFDEFFDAVSSWFSALTTDPLNTRLGEDWARLTRHLLFDADGKLIWKPELWSDIRRVIIPQIMDKVGYIPIPRAEFSDQNLDLVIENLTLSGRNMFPNIMAIEAHNFARFSPYDDIHDESHHNVVITLGQIQADLRDVMFYFHKKTGIAKIRDSGLADILLGGNGITATINLHSLPPESGSIFRVHSVHVKVDSLKFSIRDSKHDALYKFLRPFATGAVKRQIQKALGDAIKNVLETVDQTLVKVRDRMEEAKVKEGETKIGAMKELFQEQTRAKHEKQDKKTFNIVPRRQSLLLPDEGNPHAWIRKQEEEDRITNEGKEWRSKAFTVVPTATPASHVLEPTAGSSGINHHGVLGNGPSHGGMPDGAAYDGGIAGKRTGNIPNRPLSKGVPNGGPAWANVDGPVPVENGPSRIRS
ncbi:hypothetical protein M422DRAFT_774043 [Sphaerobolus stellatus SS14]|nr:hypothetical protein M422DRAFT_774043 [Sphaerobolus stellatus SS14]